MGIHKISKVPKDVASFLRLPNPHEYTGHCLRRTSATILVDNGGDITTLKRHGGWKSTSVAEGYIEDSVNNKKQIAMKILNPLEYNEPSTSSETVNIDPENNLIEDFSVNNGTIVNTETENLITSNVFNDRTVNFEKKTASSALNINNCTIQNCTFNIHVNK
uniref:Tyr recombinase domain-containing protein n=1 Tax=Anoplophora glabripennis TaxID=217634 RepID=V5G078_ANOGL